MTRPTCTCCGVAAPCCPGLTLPRTLHASFENGSFPPTPCDTCIGGTIAIVKGADPAYPAMWYGSGAFGSCGENLEVWFCINSLTPACQCFNTYWRWSNSCNTSFPPPDNTCLPSQNLACGCSPFFALALVGAGTCCNGVNNAGYSWRIHITT